MRIAKAVKEKRWNKVRTLQYLLTRSFHAKVLAVKRVVSNRGKKTPGVDGVLWQGTRRSRVNFVRYADDFVITGKSKQLLEKDIKPTVEAFLAERGLTLSPEKTVITYIKNGFTFLGQTFRKHGRTLHITPASEGVQTKVYQVVRICAIGIKRHVKIKAEANPYASEYAAYFWRRRHNKASKLLAALSARQFRVLMA